MSIFKHPAKLHNCGHGRIDYVFETSFASIRVSESYIAGTWHMDIVDKDDGLTTEQIDNIVSALMESEV